jgi:hypothetical protein
MAILEPTKLETANYGTVGWNAIYSSNFQKINDYLKKFNWSITTITYSASITVDWNASDVQIVTLTGNATINFSNPRPGGKYVLLVKQDGAGGRTITWGSNIVCDIQPKSTANSITAFFFIYDSTNSKYICVQQEALNTAVVSIGNNPPSNVVQGLLWVDTSGGNFVLKVYDGATWQIVQADVYLSKIDGGNL